MQGDQQLRIRVLNRLFFPMIFGGQPCNFQRLNQKTALWIVAKAPMQCGSSIYNWCTQLCLNSSQMLQGTNKLLSQIWDWIFPLVSPPRITTWWAMNSTISIQLSCLHGFPDPVGQACPIWEAPVVGASISDFYSKEARCCKKGRGFQLRKLFGNHSTVHNPTLDAYLDDISCWWITIKSKEI